MPRPSPPRLLPFALVVLAACSADAVLAPRAPAAPAVPAATSRLAGSSDVAAPGDAAGPRFEAEAGLPTDASLGATDGDGAARPTASGADAGPWGAPGASAPAARPRIGSIAPITWIYGAPSRRGQPIGYLRPGTAVTLRATEPVRGDGCTSHRWYAVEPRGFVCADSTATLALDDELFRALSAVLPSWAAPLPYRYGFSTGAPMYGRPPTAEEQRRVERAFRPVHRIPRERKPSSGHEELAGPEPIAAWGAPPWFVRDGRELPRASGKHPGLVRWEIPDGSLMAYASALELGGRTFLLTPDLTLVPADRVLPFRESSFHGVQLGREVRLPIAWTRKSPRPRYVRAQDGSLAESGASWPPRVWIPLTGARVEQRGETFLETRESGAYVRASDASVVEPRAQLPFSVAPDEKWIDVSIDRGTLTLHVGQEAVFSTLASPGAGGAPPPSARTNEEHVQGSWTPLGIYRIHYKVRSTTMTPENKPNPERFWIAEVPYTLYFRQPFAIHGAYWHEDFGQPKSGGCVNLSPADARFVFEWTEPKVPPEWTGATGSAGNGLGTKVVIRR